MGGEAAETLGDDKDPQNLVNSLLIRLTLCYQAWRIYMQIEINKIVSKESKALG